MRALTSTCILTRMRKGVHYIKICIQDNNSTNWIQNYMGENV